MLLIFSKMLTIGLLLGTGVLIYRFGIVTQSGSREISGLIVQLCSPIMIISNALTDDSEFTLGKLALTFLVCLVIYACFILLGHLLPHLMGAAPETRPSYLMLSLFGNVGFIGIPVSLSILGPSSMLYVIVFNVLYSLIFYTYGQRIISKAVGQAIPFRFSSLCNTGTVSCLLAIAIYVFRLSPPAVLSETLTYISNCTTFLSMLVLGINLATSSLKTLLANPRVYLFILLRSVALPILLALLLGPLFSDTMMVTTLVLMAAMPAGNMPVMLASQYGMDTDTLTSGIITSTILCLVTIPLVSHFFPA